MDQTKAEYSSKFNRLAIIWLRIETRVRSGGVYLKEFEPAQILITIDGS